MVAMGFVVERTFLCEATHLRSPFSAWLLTQFRQHDVYRFQVLSYLMQRSSTVAIWKMHQKDKDTVPAPPKSETQKRKRIQGPKLGVKKAKAKAVPGVRFW